MPPEALKMESEQADKLELEELRTQEAEEDYDGGGKRRLFRFKPRFDVVLVREVIRCFPWAAGYGRTRSAWMQVAQHVQSQLEEMGSLSFSKGAALDHAIVKRRVDMLLDAYRKDEMAGLRGSGTPEEVEMRSKLLAVLLRVVDEQTMNKGAMREKRVQQALQEALTSLTELEDTGVLPVTLESAQHVVALPPAAAAATGAVPSNSLMAIAPAPPAATVARTSTVQQNGSNNKRPLRTPPVSAPVTPASSAAAVVASLAPVAAKRQRVDPHEASLSFEERALRVEERRLALDEQRLAWEKQKAAQDTKERQALVDLLRSQGALLAEVATHLRNP